jgi:hypothetical protein
LIIRLIIQTIRQVPSRPDAIDEAPNVSRADPSGADQSELAIWLVVWAFLTMPSRSRLPSGRVRQPPSAMWALGGLVSIALGVVLAIRPDIGALTLATVFGLFSIVYGVSALILAAQSRRVGNAAKRLLDSAA